MKNRYYLAAAYISFWMMLIFLGLSQWLNEYIYVLCSLGDACFFLVFSTVFTIKDQGEI